MQLDLLEDRLSAGFSGSNFHFAPEGRTVGHPIHAIAAADAK